MVRNLATEDSGPVGVTPDQPARLCLIRHGETDWNVAGILQGWTDVPLNGRGRGQALEMAATFAGVDFAAIWTSPLQRAAVTAQLISTELRSIPVRVHEGLKERHFGVIQGVPKAELADSNPLLLQQILRRNPAADFEQGETMDGFADRVLGALGDIALAHAGQQVLVISHGWAMDVVTRHTGGLPRSAILNHKRQNAESLWLLADMQGGGMRWSGSHSPESFS